MDTQNNQPNIKGWGADLDHNNRPAYPMERIPARDIGVHWEKPEQQKQTVEILVSKERPGITSLFGTTVPLRGLSGKFRKFAFKYSENDIRHWMILLLADRVDMVEGILDDLKSGHFPNLYKEMGLKAELRHNKIGFAKRVVLPTLVIGALGYFLVKRVRR